MRTWARRIKKTAQDIAIAIGVITILTGAWWPGLAITVTIAAVAGIAAMFEWTSE